jgi:predicted ATPase
MVSNLLKELEDLPYHARTMDIVGIARVEGAARTSSLLYIHFRYAVERIAGLAASKRATILRHVQEHLLLHCPQAVWTLVKGLGCEHLYKIKLEACAKLYAPLL